MTLPDILREVLRRIDTGETVTIAREDEHAYQIRFIQDRTTDRGWRSEGRRWLAESKKVPTRGYGNAYIGWARWSTHLGWQVEAVIADDWRFL